MNKDLNQNKIIQELSTVIEQAKKEERENIREWVENNTKNVCDYTIDGPYCEFVPFEELINRLNK